MTRFEASNHLPDELREVEERLRAAVQPAAGGELDQIKLRVLSRTHGAHQTRRGRAPLVSRWLALALAGAALGGTAATAAASGGFTDWGGNAAVAQYQPVPCYKHDPWARWFGHSDQCKQPPRHH